MLGGAWFGALFWDGGTAVIARELRVGAYFSAFVLCLWGWGVVGVMKLANDARNIQYGEFALIT